MNRDPEELSRRATTRRLLVLAAVGSGLHATPRSWRRPLVESVILPAHAQASQINFGSSVRLRSASTELRTPSGGGDVEALATLTTKACVGVAGVSVTCTATADIGGGAVVSLGSNTVTADASGGFVSVFVVPILSIAPVASVVSVTITCTAAGVSTSATLMQPAINDAIGGSPNISPIVCSV